MGNRKKDKASDKKKGKQQKPRGGTAHHRADAEEVKRKKLARILKSNGPEAARKWAENHEAVYILDGLSYNESQDGKLSRSKIAQLAHSALKK